MGHLVIEFLSMIKDAKHLEMMEFTEKVSKVVGVDWTVKQRTSEEQGSGHVDNTRGQMDLASAPDGKRANYTEIIEELLAMLNAMISKQQDLEVNAGLSLAEYKGAVDAENLQLNFMISDEKRNLASLGDQLTNC
jgi:hypothetical protein